MTTTATPALTPEMIESAVNGLPLQGRVMMRLLLLQYFDVSQEDVDYMASDRPTRECNPGLNLLSVSRLSKRSRRSSIGRRNTAGTSA